MGRAFTVAVNATRYVEVCAKDEEDAKTKALYRKWGWRQEGWDDFETEITNQPADDLICDDTEDEEEE